ncbi:twin-arginine translocase subunit TatC [Planctellipticum variicoloris]|uniref:twin-arginine translocase subunit TatC n=1 Tax=Planctellipticum variicoloris TaxID=3064265 RepID=UPI003014091D|nr:twin-arginine translocase subunit TatC [Planctomycetaceae bacterium SH412]
MPPSKDLFDDSVMTFGEHLEALRTHLIRAILGLFVAMAGTLYYGESLVIFIRMPIDTALRKANIRAKQTEDMPQLSFWDMMKQQFAPAGMNETQQKEFDALNDPKLQKMITIEIPADALASQLHDLAPEQYPAAPAELKDKTLKLEASSTSFADLRDAVKRIDSPITLNVQEAFMTYLKVALVGGLVIASPWIFYQLWLFVAAGLYPHEQKYVYTYLPMSIVLFLGGVTFCYYAVLPTVLGFLLDFNVRMGLLAQIRISEWISFAIMMPLMFGISFQLPLIMLFLQKISIFGVKDYREKRKIAILAITVLSMILTPTPDPMSMLMMMLPLLALYELGIRLCILTEQKDPLEQPA